MGRSVQGCRCWSYHTLAKIPYLGIPIDKYSDISDSSLGCLVSEVKRSNPNIGVSMLQGYLKSQSCNVQRRTIRESVLRVCPMRAMVRWHQTISRRSPGPNSLWHIDGHHSLIRWRFVVHGCMDGFSRMIPYLSCCTDNLAATVLRLFRQATSEFGIPSRVRSDSGGENTLVCFFMVSQRGPGRGSHIAEALWLMAHLGSTEMMSSLVLK